MLVGIFHINAKTVGEGYYIMAPKTLLVEDFLIPSLRNKTFGKYLEWVNEEKGIFRWMFSHKNRRDWNEQDCCVSMKWYEIKENKKDKNCTDSKSRFKTALSCPKLRHKIKELNTLRKPNYRYYQLLKYKKQSFDAEDIDVQTKDEKLSFSESEQVPHLQNFQYSPSSSFILENGKNKQNIFLSDSSSSSSSSPLGSSSSSSPPIANNVGDQEMLYEITCSDGDKNNLHQMQNFKMIDDQSSETFNTNKNYNINNYVQKNIGESSNLDDLENILLIEKNQHESNGDAKRKDDFNLIDYILRDD